MRTLLKYLKGYRLRIGLGLSFKLGEAVLELFVPVLMAQIIDVGIADGNKAYILQHGLWMIALGACGVALGLTCQFFAARVAQGFGRTLRKTVFRHVFGLSAAQYNALGTDALITRCTNDVNQVQTGVNMFIRLASRAPFLAIGSIIMALVTNWKLGLIFVCTTPLIALILFWNTKKSLPMYKDIQRKQEKISRLTGENLEGVRVIRAFSRQQTEREQYAQSGDALAQETIRVGKLSAMLNPLTLIIVNIGVAVIVWMGAGAVNTGVFTAGKIIALVNYMTQNLLALIVLANIIVIFSKALACAFRLEEILQLQPEMQYGQKSFPDNKAKPAVSFRKVSFSYADSSENAVQDINFTVKCGSTLGIIGGTGCGKSTVIQLLCRRFDATEGEVLLGGTPIRQLSQAALQQNIGLVQQASVMFSGTVRQNLCMGRQDADDAELWRALRIAQGEEFVKKMPNGLDTQINEGGKNLSGGQKQRLAIARALVLRPQILVLDDSFSALDFATDAALRRALKKELSETTVIMVSQRASTVMRADTILVLNDGEQAGCAAHETLLHECEVYREICESQGVTAKEAAQ